MGLDATQSGQAVDTAATANGAHDWSLGSVRDYLAQLLTIRNHTRDFTSTRAEYIRARLTTMQLLFAVGFLAWTPLDYLMLEGQGEATGIMIARVVLAAVLFGLWFGTRRETEYRGTTLLLALTMLSVAVFYTVSMAILGQAGTSELIGGYRALPFVLIVLSALFPGTLVAGALLIGMIIALFLAVEFYLGTLFTIGTANFLWMLVVVGGIVMWVQAGQLSILLQLYDESAHDPVTGLLSRRVMERAADRELALAREQGQPVALFSLELDQLEDIRGQHGQHASDAILRRTTRLLGRELGEETLMGRYDGQVLAALVVGTEVMEAVVRAEKLQSALEALSSPAPEGGESIRLQPLAAVTRVGEDERFDDAMERVSLARPRARRASRNKVVLC